MMGEIVMGEPKFMVAVYETHRRYGGPEEGGWWYDEGHLVYSEECFTENWAGVRMLRLSREWNAMRRAPRCDGGPRFTVEWRDVFLEGMPVEHFPERRPRYE